MLLYLIRHTHTQADPNRNAALWSLSEKGRQQAEKLPTLPFWASISDLYTSAEAKAIETGEIIAQKQPHLRHTALPGLNEAKRSSEWISDEEYRQAVARLFANPNEPAAPDWQTASNLLATMVATVNELVKRHEAEPVAIVSHGLALTLYRAHILGRAATVADWQLLSFGCWAIVDPGKGELVQDWTHLA